MLIVQNPMGCKEPERLELHCPDCAGIVGLPRRGYGHSIPGHPLQSFPAGAVHPAVLMLRGTKVLTDTHHRRTTQEALYVRHDNTAHAQGSDCRSDMRLACLQPQGICHLRNKLNDKMEFPQILDLEVRDVHHVVLSKYAFLYGIFAVACLAIFVRCSDDLIDSPFPDVSKHPFVARTFPSLIEPPSVLFS